jgi:hypothetical protein
VELIVQFGFEVGRLWSLHLTLPKQLTVALSDR